jgi:DNA-binding MarR family transcriptional regulator
MSNVSQSTRKSRAPRADTTVPEQVIPHLLKNLHHSLRQAVDVAFRESQMEMSFAHFVTLFTLESEPGVAGAEIARRAFVTAQTMNTLLRRLEADGHIERQPHPTNVRADSWYITSAGQVRLNRAKIVGDSVWRRMLSSLKDIEVKQLQSFLERCISGLDRYASKPDAQSRRSAARKPLRGAQASRSRTS